MEKETYIDQDGFKHCKTCGKRLERYIDIPLMNGTNETQRRMVKCLCECDKREMEKSKAEERFRNEMAKIKKLKSASLMDDRLKDACFETFKVDKSNEKLIRIARNYVENFDKMIETGQGILFYGNVGTGKSYVSAVIANELINRQHSAVMTSFIKLLEKIKGFDTADNEYIEKLNSCKLLIIDDLGAERSTDFALEKVYNVIDSRYRTGKPLILTTNLELLEMKNCADIRYNRIYDRIFEMCYPVKVEGMSWRKMEAAQRFKKTRAILEG